MSTPRRPTSHDIVRMFLRLLFFCVVLAGLVLAATTTDAPAGLRELGLLSVLASVVFVDGPGLAVKLIAALADLVRTLRSSPAGGRVAS